MTSKNKLSIGIGTLAFGLVFGACFGLLIGWGKVLSDLECNDNILSITNQVVVSLIGAGWAGIIAGIAIAIGALPDNLSMTILGTSLFSIMVSLLSAAIMATDRDFFTDELISIGIVGGIAPSSFFIFLLLSLSKKQL